MFEERKVAPHRTAKRGPDKLPPEQKRKHCVSVRLNEKELEELDSVRGKWQRGEWMRMATLGKLPPQIPELNREAWVELSRTASNLFRLANALGGFDEEEFYTSIEQARTELANFRSAIIGALPPGVTK